MSRKQRGSVFFGAVAAATMLFGVAAFACTNLATLNLSSAVGKTGDSVTVTGSSFRVAKAGVSDPVLLHWGGAEGAVLASVVPDKAGNVQATFTVPEGKPDFYVLVATQKDSKGVDAYGTPARASFQVVGPNGEAATTPVAGQPTTPPVTEPSSAGILALTVGLGVLGLALFGAGFTSFVRQARRQAPQTAKVRRD